MDNNHGVIRVTLGGRMPPELENRVKTRAQARAMCRGFLGHCEDIMTETIGDFNQVEEFNDAIDMGRDVLQRLHGLDGSMPVGLFSGLFVPAGDL